MAAALTPDRAQAAVDLMRQGLSNREVGRLLRMDAHTVARLRRTHGIPQLDSQPLTLEEKWASKTRPIAGGHLEWTGSHGTSAGTPVLVYRGTLQTAARIAFRIKHGREHEGQAKPECTLRHCVAPDHVLDTPGRTATRERLRLLMGMGARPDRCARGHDQAEHGRLQPDGVAYCAVCHDGVRRRGGGGP